MGSNPTGAIINTGIMNIIATLIIAVVAELASPDYVSYPVGDIILDVPQFTNSPKFGMDKFSEREHSSRGYVDSENSRIDTIRMIIQEDLRSKGIEALVFFFDGNFIVKYR